VNRFFTRILLASLLGPIASLAISQEGTESATTDIVISTGLEGGGYWNTGNRLQTAAGNLGLTVENQVSTGSLSNLKALLDENSPVNLAFAQADALQYYLNENTEAAQVVETLENIGEECVFIISGSNSDIKTDKDMQKQDRMHLGIKSPNSGIRVTFDYMTSLVPELKNVTVRYGNTVEMITELAHPKTNIEKAVMVVHEPSAHSPEIDMVIANPDKFRFVKISDGRLTQSSASGAPIYRSMRVAPGAIQGAGAVQTICVNGLLLANNNKLSDQQRGKLTDLIDNHWAQIHTTSR
jgi:TRAP-type uncharacterized transport system substrate-binding protein